MKSSKGETFTADCNEAYAFLQDAARLNGRQALKGFVLRKALHKRFEWGFNRTDAVVQVLKHHKLVATGPGGSVRVSRRKKTLVAEEVRGALSPYREKVYFGKRSDDITDTATDGFKVPEAIWDKESPADLAIEASDAEAVADPSPGHAPFSPLNYFRGQEEDLFAEIPESLPSSKWLEQTSAGMPIDEYVRRLEKLVVSLKEENDELKKRATAQVPAKIRRIMAHEYRKVSEM